MKRKSNLNSNQLMKRPKTSIGCYKEAFINRDLPIYIFTKKLGVEEFLKINNFKGNLFHFPIIFSAIYNGDIDFAMKYIQCSKVSINEKYVNHTIFEFCLVNLKLKLADLLIDLADKQLIRDNVENLFNTVNSVFVLKKIIPFMVDNSLILEGDKYENITQMLNYLLPNLNLFECGLDLYIDIPNFVRKVILRKREETNIIINIIKNEKYNLLSLILCKFPEIRNYKFKNDQTVMTHIIIYQHKYFNKYDNKIRTNLRFLNKPEINLEIVNSNVKDNMALFDINTIDINKILLNNYFKELLSLINSKIFYSDTIVHNSTISMLMISNYRYTLYSIFKKLPLLLTIFNKLLPNEMTILLLSGLFMLKFNENNKKIVDYYLTNNYIKYTFNELNSKYKPKLCGHIFYDINYRVDLTSVSTNKSSFDLCVYPLKNINIDKEICKEKSALIKLYNVDV